MYGSEASVCLWIMTLESVYNRGLFDCRISVWLWNQCMTVHCITLESVYDYGIHDYGISVCQCMAVEKALAPELQWPRPAEPNKFMHLGLFQRMCCCFLK